MSVTNAEQARAWLKSWAGKPRAGILLAAIQGTELAIAVLVEGPARRGYQEALEILQRNQI